MRSLQTLHLEGFMTTTHYAPSSAAAGWCFAQRPLNLCVSLGLPGLAQILAHQSNICLPEKGVVALSEVHTYPGISCHLPCPLGPRCSACSCPGLPVAWFEPLPQEGTPSDASLSPSYHFCSGPQWQQVQQSVLTLHQKQRHTSALQRKDSQICFVLEGFDGQSLSEHELSYLGQSLLQFSSNRQATKTKTFKDT